MEEAEIAGVDFRNVELLDREYEQLGELIKTLPWAEKRSKKGRNSGSGKKVYN